MDTPESPKSLTIAQVVPQGDLRASLEAIRDRLAFETDDTLWAKHKKTCHCECGMGDGRLLVALTKRLSEVLAELSELPVEGGKTNLDSLSARVDDLAPRRARRVADSASS